jgi:hypothetical protein
VSPEGLQTLQRRLQGVLVARQYVMMDYDLPVGLIEAAIRHHSRPRVAHDLSAARQGLGRCSLDGEAGRT